MVAGERYPVRAGSVVVVPAGTLHNFIANGGAPLKLYTVYTPPEHPDAASGADAYVTGDLDYHDALLAESLGLVALDAGHAATELPSLGPLARRLAEFVDVPVSVSRVLR